jgi:hypothetical protein
MIASITIKKIEMFIEKSIWNYSPVLLLEKFTRA